MVEILTFIEIFLILLFTKIYTQKKVMDKLYIDIALSGVSALIFYVLTSIFKANIFITLILTGTMLVFIRSKITKSTMVVNLIAIIMSLLTILLIEIVITMILFYILKHEAVEFKSTLFFMLLLNSATIYILNFIVQKQSINVVQRILKCRQYSLIIINGMIFFLLIKVLIDNDLLRFELVIHFFVIFVLLIGTNILYFINEHKRQKENKRIEIKDSINPLIGELLDNLRASEHEYKNHLNIIYCMMQVCDTDELRNRAKKYIGGLMEENKVLSELTEVNNTIVKALLFSKIQEFEKCGIYYEFDIESSLENIKIDDSELTVLLSNLINNAIEAAKESLEKEIYMFIGEQEDKYIIRVSNTCNDLEKIKIDKICLKGYSSKGENRGYGMYNISEIISKHKGNLKIFKEENMLNIQIEI